MIWAASESAAPTGPDTTDVPDVAEADDIPPVQELREIMSRRRLTFEEERYILRGELIQAYRKPGHG